MLNGDGTRQSLLGIIPQATAYAAPFAPTDATVIDKIRLAMLQAQRHRVEPDRLGFARYAV